MLTTIRKRDGRDASFDPNKITEAIYKVLYEKVDVKKAIEEFMLREGKAEQSSQNVEKGSKSI